MLWYNDGPVPTTYPGPTRSPGAGSLRRFQAPSSLTALGASAVSSPAVLALHPLAQQTSPMMSSLFWLTNAAGATILRGSIHENCCFYCLNLSCAHTIHKPETVSTSPTLANDMPTTAHYAARMPDVETWHRRRLSHCNFGTIAEMARKHAVKGMSINLSSSPPKCEPCILGKQTHSPVSKVREGERATRPLEHVFVDICGPIKPVSSSGRLYSMNVIDDFSSYVTVWSLPLRSKGDAAPMLQKWYRTVENQSEIIQSAGPQLLQPFYTSDPMVGITICA